MVATGSVGSVFETGWSGLGVAGAQAESSKNKAVNNPISMVERFTNMINFLSNL
jgi:hypothetical protein